MSRTLSTDASQHHGKTPSCIIVEEAALFEREVFDRVLFNAQQAGLLYPSQVWHWPNWWWGENEGDTEDERSSGSEYVDDANHQVELV